jgi:hypothetical protein
MAWDEGAGIMQQQLAIVKTGTVQLSAPMLRRFATKLALDVFPAALTSIVGGVLVAHYQFGHIAQRPATEQVAPASTEMVKLVRDEHSAIMDYLKEQIAAEKSRNAAADAADARAAAEAKASVEASVAPPVVRALPASVIAPKPVVVRSKPVVAAAVLPPHQPVVVAQAAPETAAAPVVQPAPQPKSLLSRTLDLKDHVVGATLHLVTSIGGIPSWIASMGDHKDNVDTTPNVPTAPSAAGRSFAS